MNPPAMKPSTSMSTVFTVMPGANNHSQWFKQNTVDKNCIHDFNKTYLFCTHS